MRLLVSGSTVSCARLMAERPDRIGVLLTPRSGNRTEWAVERNAVWAGDNDCFVEFHAARWLRFLAKAVEAKGPPAFISLPDVVGDSAETLRRFAVWRPTVKEVGLPVALVGQDGLTPDAVPWSDLDALFVGGTTEWKLGPVAAELCVEAKRLGKWVHIGRVNSKKRILHFARLGAGVVDSYDGTGFSAYGDKRIPLAIRWTDEALVQAAAEGYGYRPPR